MMNILNLKQRALLWWLLMALVLFLAGCVSGEGVARKAPRIMPGQSLVSVYFSTVGASTERISFEIDEVAILMGDLWIDLPAEALVVDRQKVQGKQLLLGIGAFPAGDCSRMRFKLKGIKLAGNSGPGLEDQMVELPFNKVVSLAGGDSTCLFIEWHLVPPLPGEIQFSPHFTVKGQEMPLGGDLAYAVCDDIDTLYMVRTDINFVVASLGLPGPLGELAVDPLQRRLYVLSAGERAILVFDSVNAQKLDRIPLSITIKPRHMALSEDGMTAFVTDSATNRVLRVDLLNGIISQQATVGIRPERIIYFEDNGSHRLAVSSPTAQRVFILNADTLDPVREIPAGNEADSLLFWDERLYVAERGSNLVSVFDYQTGRQLARVTVGFEPSFIIGVDRKIFVSNYRDDSLSVFHAGQSTTARRIPVGSGPYAMAISDRRRLLYVADREADKLTILDLTAERVTATVSLGGRPFSVGVLD